MNRREALRNLAGFLAASPVLRAQDDARLAPFDDLVNVFEMEAIAKARLSRQLYDHISGGAGGEVTLRRNREAFDRITFRPRVLIDVREMNLRTSLFGEELEWPVLVAPLSGQQRLHPEGDAATLQGVGSTKTVTVVASHSSAAIEQLSSSAKGPFWCQMDPDSDGSRVRATAQNAAKAGCKAICVSFGAPYVGVRERDLKNGQLPAASPHPSRLISRSAANSGWSILQQIRDASHLPVLAKGIMHPDDAQTAIEKGAQGVVVSNYGGFYLDGSAATIDVLPIIVEAVKGRVPVLIDGGFRRGTDILKALALGASAVMVGRPVLWGLAGYGAQGVQKVVELLQTELALAMGLSGVPSIAGITRSLVKIHRPM
jgi:4-hydroxymandelate oxidase